MKKLVQINVVCNGSTGRIMCDIAKKAQENGLESYCFYGRGNPNNDVKCIKVGNKFSIYFHVLLTRVFNKHGHGSYFATKKMVKLLKKINPDIIHLHNIHGYFINLKILFNYLKKEYKGKVIWTLHDCWAFTGHCSYFTMAKCKKWKKQCFSCPQVRTYPKSLLFDTSKKEYMLKKELFSGVKNLTIVTPSIWLKELVKKSFLKKYNVEVINNGIDLNSFKENIDTQIYGKYNIPKNKKIILGVANIWEKRKGLDDFLELSKILEDDYIILLVGKLDKKNIEKCKNIVHINRTDNINELVNIYSIADIFFNPTYEDNYPTTNLESISCGAFVICYNTGGCKEQISLNDGIIIDKKDINFVYNLIKQNISTTKKNTSTDKFNKDNKYNQYLKLYH